MDQGENQTVERSALQGSGSSNPAKSHMSCLAQMYYPSRGGPPNKNGGPLAPSAIDSELGAIEEFKVLKWVSLFLGYNQNGGFPLGSPTQKRHSHVSIGL